MAFVLFGQGRFKCFKVHFALQEHLTPYMCDAGHAPDILFFVCAEDFEIEDAAKVSNNDQWAVLFSSIRTPCMLSVSLSPGRCRHGVSYIRRGVCDQSVLGISGHAHMRTRTTHACVRAGTCPRTRARVHAHIPARARACGRACMRACLSAHPPDCPPARKRACLRACVHA